MERDTKKLKAEVLDNKQVAPHTLVSFEKHIMNIDLKDFNNVDFEDEKFNNTYRMQNISQLRLQYRFTYPKILSFRYKNFSKNFYSRTGISNFIRNVRMDNKFKDSALYNNYYTHLRDFPIKKQLDAVNNAINLTNSNVQVSKLVKKIIFL